ncbi:integrase catalytic domain-containing protein [Trichonephila clavipes]|nr:integrase catalytic domain-containing protein [Trichonephila clavipes]
MKNSNEQRIWFSSPCSQMPFKMRLLAKMQAFRDEDGLLRIRTKLADSYEKEDFKFPILLPANDVVVKLIREEHVKTMHAGSSILHAPLREKFWIIRAKRLVKQVLSECVICKRYKAKHVEVPFAPLPRDRVTQTKIFEVTGVDYAGPLYLKSKAKAWIVLFTCAVYQAVHFELVQSLTDSFIQALRRFIERRGRISVLYSDNGTNFVGTNNALRTLDWDKIVVYSTAQIITWKFIPPTAAWWGGWWESIVRMLKELLCRVLGKSIVNYELLTIVCDCESIINARPLTYIHEDPNELLPLSPAMFIHGNSNCETPDLDQVDRSSLVKRTKYLQKRNDALEVSDVVLIGHDNVRQIDWLRCCLGGLSCKGGVPRVARIRTSHGERIRPCQRLYPLEVSAKTEIGVFKASGKDSLPVEKTPESSIDHVSDSPTDYVPDSPDDSTNNSEEKPPTKARLARTIKIPRKLDTCELFKF